MRHKVIDIGGNVIVNGIYKRKYLGDDYYAVINGNNIVITKILMKFLNLLIPNYHMITILYICTIVITKIYCCL